MPMKKICILLVLCFICASALPALARRTPGQDWQELETEHFIIIYPKNSAQAAARTAAIAEQAYPKVRDLFGYAPFGQTPIVLNSRRDVANGYAQSICRKLEFYLTCPIGKGFGPGDATWLESLLYHEYAHLCHGMRDEGFSGILTSLFGEVHGLNFMAPRWWVEGMAIYSESTLLPGGRGHNTYHRMKLAANLLSEAPWSLSQIGVYPRFSFPFDRVYVPGFDLIHYLSRTVSNPKMLDQLSKEQSVWPFFGLGYVWRQVTNQHPEDIWQALKIEKTRDFHKIYGQPRLPLPNAVALTSAVETQYQQPQWIAENKILVYRQSIPTDSGFFIIDVPSGKETPLYQPDLLRGQYTYAAQSQTLYLSRLLLDVLYGDAYIADLFSVSEQGREKRLTENGRCWSPTVNSDGEIVCVVNQQGVTRLGKVNSKSKSVQLIPGPKGAVYLAPAWSPDGIQLAAVVRIAGKQDVCLVDIQSGKLTPITGWDEAGDFDPTWSPDGKYLVFVSDRNRTHQIFAYELAAEKLYQITDAYLGAFDPAISTDNKKIAFAEYQPGNHQQIVVAPFEPGTWIAVNLPEKQRQPQASELFDLPPAQGRGYSAWKHLLPSFWVPMAGMDQDGWLWGIASGQQDPLENHRWIGQILCQPTSGQVYGEISYLNSELPFLLTLSAFQQPQSRWGQPGVEEDTARYWARTRGFRSEVRLPLLLRQALDTRITVNLNTAYEAYKILEADPRAFPGDEFIGWQGGASFSYLCQQPKDLFPRSGFSLFSQVSAALQPKAYDGRRLYGSSMLHLPSPLAQHAITLSTRALAQAGIFPSVNTSTTPQGYAGGQFNSGYNLTFAAGYRFPLWYIDNGLGLWPVYFHDMWAEVFCDWGAGWDGYIDTAQWLEKSVYSTGLKLHLDMELFWYVPSRLNAGLIFKPQEDELLLTLDMDIGF